MMTLYRYCRGGTGDGNFLNQFVGAGVFVLEQPSPEIFIQLCVARELKNAAQSLWNFSSAARHWKKCLASYNSFFMFAPHSKC